MRISYWSSDGALPILSSSSLARSRASGSGMILSISLATGPIRPSMMLMIRYPFAERSQRSRYLPPLFGDSGVADPVRQPAVKEGFLAGAALGERDVAFALQRLHRAQQHGQIGRAHA